MDARGFRSSPRVQMARRQGPATATFHATKAIEEPTPAHGLSQAGGALLDDIEDVEEVAEMPDDDDEDGEQFQYGRHSIGTLILPDELRDAISYILQGE